MRNTREHDMASPATQLMRLKKQTESFIEKLREGYPAAHKQTAEYTRLEEALQCFLAYGAWDPPEQEENDESSS